MENIKAIIFDLGGVLIDWNPNYVFDKLFENDEEKKKEFFICNNTVNIYIKLNLRSSHCAFPKL